MFTTILLITSIILNILLLYCCVNVIKKLEQYDEWLEFFKKEIGTVYSRLKNVDDKNLFEKDDDVGFVFSEILRITKDFDERIK